MWHIGENRLDDAWTDLLAIHRLARLTAQGHTLVEQTVALSISGIACDGTLSLLSDRNLTIEQARQIERDLGSLSQFDSVNDCIGSAERLEALDALIDAQLHGVDRLFDDPRKVPRVFKMMSVDWNVALQRINKWFDRFVAIANLPTHNARNSAYAEFEADREATSVRTEQPHPLSFALFNTHQRSETIGDRVASLMMISNNSVIEFERRTNTTLQITRLAATLAVYRAEHGGYPEKLDDLVPSLLDKLPVDLYNAKPFMYKRTDDGYLLYSAGRNGQDDNGSNKSYNNFEGQNVNDLQKLKPAQFSDIPDGADDISIRLPRPMLKLPDSPVPPSEP